MARKILHKHHIIPKHAGGTDDPSNIVKLTIEQHADAHRLLYEQHNRWQDYIAWKTLSGQMSRAEAINMAQRNADKSWMKTLKGKALMKAASARRAANGFRPWNKGLSKETHPSLEQSSKRNKELREEGCLSNIGDHMRGNQFTPEHKEKLSQKARSRLKIKCPVCNKEVGPGMYKRWHGDNCRQR